MPQPYSSYRLFISHAWKEHGAYVRLLGLLKEAPNFSFRNYSVPQDEAYARMTGHQLEEELKYQIRSVNCVLVLGELYVAYNDWIQFEMDLASSLDKPIIAIRPWGSEHMPVLVSTAAKEVVGWESSAIVRAVREHAR